MGRCSSQAHGDVAQGHQRSHRGCPRRDLDGRPSRACRWTAETSPGGSSLLKFLASRRGECAQRGEHVATAFEVSQIPPPCKGRMLIRALAWALADGDFLVKFLEAPNRTWSKVQSALAHGSRGLPDGSSLARLLAVHRGVRNRTNIPPLSVEQVLSWADAFHRRTGRWPSHTSGPIPEAPGETWLGVHSSLVRGKAAVCSGGSSLACGVPLRALRASAIAGIPLLRPDFALMCNSVAPFSNCDRG